MSSHPRRLLLVLSLAACEHQTSPAKPVPAKVEVAPAPTPTEPVTAQPEPAPVEPAVTPVKPPTAATRATPPKKLVKKCNPMSRAGCRWQEETDERDTPRVTKRAVEKVTP